MSVYVCMSVVPNLSVFVCLIGHETALCTHRPSKGQERHKVPLVEAEWFAVIKGQKFNPGAI